jgi:hypothetical protein
LWIFHPTLGTIRRLRGAPLPLVCICVTSATGALLYLERALAIDSKTLSSADKRIAEDLENLASVSFPEAALHAMGNKQEAKRLAERAASIPALLIGATTRAASVK